MVLSHQENQRTSNKEEKSLDYLNKDIKIKNKGGHTYVNDQQRS